MKAETHGPPKASSPVENLLKGTVLYFFGTFVSKALQFLILPIVTSTIIPSEYGYYDIVVSTITLIIPILTLQVSDGVFRFLFDSDEEESKTIIASVIYILMIGFAIGITGVMILHWYTNFIRFPFLIAANLISTVLLLLVQKIARSQKKNKAFVYSGIINTVSILSLQCLLLFGFHRGIDGLFIASAVSSVLSTLYLLFGSGLYRLFRLQWPDFHIIREIILFSMPLVPNSISFWAMSSINSYIISLSIGTTYNGIFAIAGKFPALLTMATGVFQLSWQDSAISERSSVDRDKYYTKVFEKYMVFVMLFTAVAILVSKLALIFLVGKNYLAAGEYIPILFFAAAFGAFTMFFGVGYTVAKRTQGAVTTTIIGALANVFISIGFINYIGLFAPALGRMFGYLIVWLVRVFTMRKYINIKISWRKFSLLSILCVVALGFYYFHSRYAQFFVLIAVLATAFFVMRKDIARLIQMLGRKFQFTGAGKGNK